MGRFPVLLTTLLLSPLLGACTTVPRGLEPVEGFEVDRYLGRWYEIVRLDHSFERGLSHVTADYSLRDDGRIRVLNQGYNRERGRWQSADGVARFQGDPTVGSLSVTFRWPFSGGYHVVALDKKDYQWAVISGPNRSYFWILSRESVMEEEKLQSLISQADEWGFATEKFIHVEQESETSLPRPSSDD
ncbi:MAG: lipocalin family protein [Candidatus Sumerlaeia bacterium]|nr:lipocalin family protein [Candidatus Sumerlaeia bacterium]